MLIRHDLRRTRDPLRVTVPLFGKNLISLKSKKHSVVSRPSAESEHVAPSTLSESRYQNFCPNKTLV